MKVRPARTRDVEKIVTIISHHASQGLMLLRPNGNGLEESQAKSPELGRATYNLPKGMTMPGRPRYGACYSAGLP
jgi:hypothetical protein